jgi:hypothetical protein
MIGDPEAVSIRGIIMDGKQGKKGAFGLVYVPAGNGGSGLAKRRRLYGVVGLTVRNRQEGRKQNRRGGAA